MWFFEINKRNLAIILMLISFNLMSQNETNHWFFGENAGLDFNFGDVNVGNNGSMNTPAGCSSISTKTGALLFYTNGVTVWNKNHQVMVNGLGLASDINYSQTSIIVPKPGDENTYYIFCTRVTPGTSPLLTSGVFYSTVEFTDQYPLGNITSKNVRISSSSTERITALHNFQDNSIKVIAFGGANELPNSPKNTFYVFNVTANGINYPPTTTTVFTTMSSVGVMKISPNGEILCMADYEDRYLYFYYFNIEDSTFSHLYTINTDLFLIPITPYGLAFSQDSMRLFYSGKNHSSGRSYLFQFNFFADVDINSRPIIDTSYDYEYGSLQLATNGKIYVSNFSTNEDSSSLNSSNFISVINDPENEDDLIDYQPLSLSLESGNSLKGLPNFIPSFFRNRIIAKDKCVNETFEFSVDAYDEIDSVIWDFGDGTTSNTITPNHQYSNPGEYIVKANISINNDTTTIYKQINAFPLPDMVDGLTISNCDTDSDQTSFFNLYDSSNFINNPGNTDYQQIFYHSYLEAENNESPIEIPEVYENIENPQQLFVKNISPEGCYTINFFYIETIFAVLDTIETIIVCEDSDDILLNDEGTFNLRNKSNAIRNQFGLPDSYSLLYYASLQDAQTNTNPLHAYHNSSSTTIWVKITSHQNECYGIAPIQLIVNDPITINLEDNYTICNYNRDTPIVLDGSISNNTWQWEDNNGNILSTNRCFELTQAGIYTITVSKNQNGIICVLSKVFEVLDAETPVFNQIIAENNSISVSISGNSSYMFSIDNYAYFNSETFHVFRNLNPGVYTIYVRDKYNCESPIQTEVSLIGFPNYITPNGDNHNDYWKIFGLSYNFYNDATIDIYNRYDKLLYTMNLDSNVQGWNGTYNGAILESTDYWYKAQMTDKNNNTFIKTGHFSLLY